MVSMSQTDPCRAIISRIAAFGGSNVPVPALSKLLGIKSTTLNARFRREHTPLRTVGRTSYLPCDQALQLVELHRYALIGWPTLRAASQITDLKPATLKARCEKGRLEGHIDLTKRLRLNPAELEELRTTTNRTDGKLKPARSGTCTKLQHKAKAVTPAEMKAEVRPSGAESSDNEPRVGPVEKIPSVQRNVVFLPATKPQIQIITPKDYGLPELVSPPQTVSQRPQHSAGAHKNPPCLVYDPLKPFSISSCSRGKTIIYGQNVGTVLGLIDDPYTPMIKVAFPEHVESAMREVLLVVDKKRLPGVLT